MKLNDFPCGPLFLKELKYGFKDFIFSGKGKHTHKYNKIKALLDFYPFLTFILVGDNGQKDIEIYYNIVVDFPQRIKSIYIVQALNKNLSNSIVQNYAAHNVSIIAIKNFDEAIKHALKVGLIKTTLK
jgi:phosphatidate phosphatase APP1